MSKVVVYNLGCKVNQYESDALIFELEEMGHDVSDKLEYADIYILNTCAVTNEAERKSRQCVKRCLNYNPNARILVCGCASQNDAEQFFVKDNVTYITGVAGKGDIIGKLDAAGVDIKPLPTDYESAAYPKSLRTRTYVKIQDGCDNFCSYCLIPYLRGRSRSREIGDVVRECRELETFGEIVLTGIDISSYGKRKGFGLTDLIMSLSCINTRIRLGSLEVNVVDERFLSALAGLKNFCPQFHLSLQSGSDSVLKRMNRHYTTAQYNDKVDMIRAHFPNVAITTDVICGFPKETEEEFLETANFIRKIGFADVHVFGYSRRKGTAADKMPQFTREEIHKRVNELERVAASVRERYLQGLIGSELRVLVEEPCEGGYEGYSEEYARVRVLTHKDCPRGKTVAVRPSRVENNILIASEEN